MILWRLSPAAWAKAALDGRGAAVVGGRWNSIGLRAIYASLDPATTVLETLTAYSHASASLEGYLLLRISYTGSTEQPPLDALPARWNASDDASAARTFGDAFLRTSRAGALIVPSAVLPEALNVVLNPQHPDVSTARVLDSRPFVFDPRWPLK